MFDPGANAWSRAASLPSGRYGGAAVTAPNGTIDVVGGRRAAVSPSVPNQGGQTRMVEVFTP